MAFSWGNYDALTEGAAEGGPSGAARRRSDSRSGVGRPLSVSALEGAAASPSSLVTGLGLGPPAPSSALNEAGSSWVLAHQAGAASYGSANKPASLSALNGGEPGHSVNGHPRSLPAGGSAVVSAPDIMGSGASPPLSAPPSLPPKGGGRAQLFVSDCGNVFVTAYWPGTTIGSITLAASHAVEAKP